MAHLVRDFIPAHRTEPFINLVAREAVRGAGNSLQCLVGRKKSEFT